MGAWVTRFQTITKPQKTTDPLQVGHLFFFVCVELGEVCQLSPKERMILLMAEILGGGTTQDEIVFLLDLSYICFKSCHL